MTAVQCPTCHGAGEIGFNESRDRNPQRDNYAPCPACAGQGVLDPEGQACDRCLEEHGRADPMCPACGVE